LLRYRSEADVWDVLSGPEALSPSYRLVRFGDGVVAYKGSDERGSEPDFRFLAGEDRWVTLPDDPLPPVYDRFVVEYDRLLLLFGSPIERGSGTKLAAAYDPQTNTWERLKESGAQGYQVWRSGSLLYLNPHFGKAGGGIYDPSRNVWRPLPDPPYHDLAGILGHDGATYEYASGWVLDTRTHDWLNIRDRPDSSDVSEEVVAEGPGSSMIVFGGQRWFSGKGQLVNDAWRWTPPAVTN